MKKNYLLILLAIFTLSLTLFNCNIEHNPDTLDAVAEVTEENTADQDAVVGRASPAIPNKFYLDFVDAYLAYVTSSNSIQIITENNVLSYGGDWQKKKVYSYLYHIRHSSWSGYYWKVNTSRKKVYLVIGSNFGRIGDSSVATLSKITVDPVGNPSSPVRFFLRFSRSYLRYQPASGRLKIYAEGYLMSNGSGWQKCHVKSYLYHIRLSTWQGFYWKVNTSRKKAYRVTNAPGLCQLGGTYTKMQMGVRVY